MNNEVFIFGALDVAEACWYLFLIFFAGLILYLRREDRREGYPLEADTTGVREDDTGLFFFATPKTFELPHGRGRKVAPDRRRETRKLNARRTAVWPGAPIEPLGDPLVDGIGPAAYAERANVPDVLHDGTPKIVPLALAKGYELAKGDADPRGYRVIAADRVVAGVVKDVWVDRMEFLIRFLEVELAGAPGQRRLLPMGMAVIDRGSRAVRVRSIGSSQFVNVPQPARSDQITFYEEERVMAYYGGGYLYGMPGRAESLL